MSAPADAPPLFLTDAALAELRRRPGMTPAVLGALWRIHRAVDAVLWTAELKARERIAAEAAGATGDEQGGRAA